MGLGFSFSASSSAPLLASPIVASEAMLAKADKPQSLAKDFELVARTAAVASQLGTSAFFREINTNRYFVSRTALFATFFPREESFAEKRTRKIIRDLKVEASEASTDKPRDQ